MTEIPLLGGSVTTVVKVGDTVRRESGPWTPSVHAYLRHLEARNFPYAPRVLGVDGSGREILSFLDGEVALRPWPVFLREPTVLISIGKALRQLTDAAATFVPGGDATWRVETCAGNIRHGDIAPWNTVFRDGTLIGFIDWDFAEPAPPLWDLAQAAWYFVPLRSGGKGWRASGFEVEPDLAERLHCLCEAYGADADLVLTALEDMQTEAIRRVGELGGQGVAPWQFFLERGDVPETIADRSWLLEHRASLLRYAD